MTSQVRAGTLRAKEAQGTRSFSRVLRTEEFWSYATAPVALIVLIIGFTIATPRFITWTNLTGMLGDAAIPVILALGSTFAVALAGIDLSLAANVALGTVVMGAVYQAGWPLWLAALTAILTGLAVGAVNGFFVGRVRIPDFIVTLGSLSLLMGLSLILSNGTPVVMQVPALTAISTNAFLGIRYDFILVIVMALILHVVMFNTRFGTHLLAVGDNKEAARAMGLRVPRIRLAGYMICGLMGGLGAVFLASYVGASTPPTNTNYLLNAIAAVVLGGVSLFGGKATIVGPVLGAVLLTFLQDGLTMLGVSDYYSPFVIGIVVIAAATLMRGRR
jgi:ribose/xylose/arabinose/galactoside ABC-type transport system permease subunit